MSKIPDWSGTLSRTDGITGNLMCSFTGWRMAVTGTLDGKDKIHLTARFDSPTFSDDAAPWIAEHEMIKPHEAQAGGYDGMWVGTIVKNTGAWFGDIADRYGGRLKIEGKPQGNGVMSLRAVVSLEEVRG